MDASKIRANQPGCTACLIFASGDMWLKMAAGPTFGTSLGGGAPTVYECLNEINHDLDSLHYELSQISILVATSGSMNTSHDESTIIVNLRISVTSAIKFLPLARHDMNNQAAFCGASTVVVVRAQTGLPLLVSVHKL